VVERRGPSHVEREGEYVDMQVLVASDFKGYIRSRLALRAATHRDTP
jgi:hypothetical protein